MNGGGVKRSTGHIHTHTPTENKTPDGLNLDIPSLQRGVFVLRRTHVLLALSTHCPRFRTPSNPDLD